MSRWKNMLLFEHYTSARASALGRASAALMGLAIVTWAFGGSSPVLIAIGVVLFVAAQLDERRQDPSVAELSQRAQLQLLDKRTKIGAALLFLLSCGMALPESHSDAPSVPASSTAIDVSATPRLERTVLPSDTPRPTRFAPPEATATEIPTDEPTVAPTEIPTAVPPTVAPPPTLPIQQFAAPVEPPPPAAQPPEPAGPQPPVASGGDGSCPASHPYKGNRNSMKYHRPGCPHYYKTKAEECFASGQDAQAAGYVLSGGGG